MGNSLPLISLVLSPKEFDNRVLEIRTMDNKDWGELLSFLVREDINVVMFDNEVKLFSSPRKRGKPLKEDPCEGMSLVWICETSKHWLYRKDQFGGV